MTGWSESCGGISRQSPVSSIALPKSSRRLVCLCLPDRFDRRIVMGTPSSRNSRSSTFNVDHRGLTKRPGKAQHNHGAIALARQRVTGHHVHQVTQDICSDLFDALDSRSRDVFDHLVWCPGAELLVPIIRVCPERIRSVQPGRGDKLCIMPSCDRRQVRNARPIREYRPGEPDVIVCRRIISVSASSSLGCDPSTSCPNAASIPAFRMEKAAYFIVS
jgi:hypothetical protein